MRRMQMCLMIEGQENVTWDQWVALARAAEEHGFNALFRSDHYQSLGGADTTGSLDAWSTICGLAAITERIHLGTLVSPVTFRPPSVLAKSVITADHISGGRVELGMGAGWNEREHRAWGFEFPPSGERVEILEEQLEIVHRLMSKERPVTFEGRHYRLEDAPASPKPVQDPHPRLLVGGGGGPKVTRLAALWADEYNTYSQSPDECREIRRRLDHACETAGRDPASLPLSIMASFAIGATAAEAAGWAARLCELRGVEPGSDPIATLGDHFIAGTPERALERLARFAEAGVERVMLRHMFHAELEPLALIGAEIIPPALAL
jgi:F420-dependent oxidoreductase-like protein